MGHRRREEEPVHRHSRGGSSSSAEERHSRPKHRSSRHRSSRRRSPSTDSSEYSSRSRSERRHRRHHHRSKHRSRHETRDRDADPLPPAETQNYNTQPAPPAQQPWEPPRDGNEWAGGPNDHADEIYQPYDPSQACQTGDYGNLFEDVPAIDWRSEALVELIKDFYIEHPLVKNMTKEEVETFRRKRMIIVTDERCPKPLPDFSMAPLPTELMERLKAFPYPTPIQCQALPIAMSGYDLIGIAQTGSGKTLAYLLPALVHCKAQPPMQKGQGPIVLIMAPTRELAMQISEEGEKYLGEHGMNICTIVGGDTNRVFDQRNQLRDAPHIVVACPGRLADHVRRGNINFKRVTYFVLDEADRLLDMGFGPQILAASKLIRPERQTLMWSATWPTDVKEMAREIFRGRPPIFLKIGKQGDTSVTAIEHTFVYLDSAYDAPAYLMKYIEDKADKRMLVFTNTKRECDSLMDQVNSEVPNALAMVIHGDKTQMERTRAVSEFRAGRCNILIATDVIARGLDFENVHAVINYRMPRHKEEWIHRIGRTGRAGVPGLSLSLLTRSDFAIMQSIEETLQNTYAELPASYLEAMQKMNGFAYYDAPAYGSRSGGRGRGRGRSYGGGGGYNSAGYGGHGGGYKDTSRYEDQGWAQNDTSAWAQSGGGTGFAKNRDEQHFGND